MKTGAGMVQDKRMDMGSMGDFNGVVGKNPGPRHQAHKDSGMDRSPYYDKVCSNVSVLWNTPLLVVAVTALDSQSASFKVRTPRTVMS